MSTIKKKADFRPIKNKNIKSVSDIKEILKDEPEPTVTLEEFDKMMFSDDGILNKKVEPIVETINEPFELSKNDISEIYENISDDLPHEKTVHVNDTIISSILTDNDIIETVQLAAVPTGHYDNITENNVKNIELRIKYLKHYDGLPSLEYKSNGAAGFDIYAATNDRIILNKLGGTDIIPTGICIELPPGYEAQVRSRSGLAINNGIAVINSPGTIDEDYRGEIKVGLINHSKTNFPLERGMRIAQIVIAPVTRANFVKVDELSGTERGENGFGSTGI